MNQQRKQHSAAKKVEILREHLENQVPISELSRHYGIHPNLVHKWKKQLFESAVDTFSHKRQNISKGHSVHIESLKEKIKDKDSLIAEVLSDNIR